MPSLHTSGQAVSIPEPLVPAVSVNLALSAEANAIRLSKNPISNTLFYLLRNGDVYEIEKNGGLFTATLRYSTEDHGVSGTAGFTFGPDGSLYIVGNESLVSSKNIATIKKGIIQNNERVWATLAQTEPYPKSNTAFDHAFNGIAVSPDGQFVFVNSGSRTDHGEEQNAEGLFPGVREVPLTASIFRIPSSAKDLVLPNDINALRDAGHLYAEGLRNSFDLAFNRNSELFATENSGERDDPDELNWIREGHHYGFPWRLGSNDTPQQFAGYNPETDLLVSKNSYAYRQGFFYNDPEFPAPPPAVTFTDPILNNGPDATFFRDGTTGTIKNEGRLSTFTSHRSPLGLAFDTDNALPHPFKGTGFALGWNTGADGSGTLLAELQDPGQDLLHLDLEMNNGVYEATITRIVDHFNKPIDTALLDDKLYVLDWEGNHSIWEITFDGGLIPVELSSFNAVVNNINVVHLNWETSSEINNAGFQVQHRTEDSAFETVGFVEGHGTSTIKHFYIFEVQGLSPGNHYFRLKQIDFDGAFTLSEDLNVFLSLETAYSLSSPFPNPFNPSMSFSLTVAKPQNVSIDIYNMLGQRVTEVFEGFLHANSPQQFGLDGSTLPSGTYIIKILGDNFEDSRRISLIR
ncbi:MAG: T9SS type A sorting domain-containing protein [Rhodothermales bacterium]